MNYWFNVPTAQTLIFTLFLNAEVLFDGAFSLWVSFNLTPYSFSLLLLVTSKFPIFILTVLFVLTKKLHLSALLLTSLSLKEINISEASFNDLLTLSILSALNLWRIVIGITGNISIFDIKNNSVKKILNDRIPRINPCGTTIIWFHPTTIRSIST